MSDDITEDDLRAIANEIFMNSILANEWLQTALPALGGQTPELLMRDTDGRLQIRTLLERLKNGDFC